MAVTLAEIAALAGVSRGTVDRALNDRGRVDPKVAARVRRIAAERGYRPEPCGTHAGTREKPDQDRRDRPVGRDHVHAHGI